MRILAVGNVYPPHLLGGYEIVWKGSMDHLRASGHRVRVLTTDYRSPTAPEDDPNDPGVHRQLRWYWRDHEWPALSLLGRLTIELHNARMFDAHVREFSPDVVTWWPVGGLSLGLIERAQRAGLPAVFFVHDYWPTYAPDHDLWLKTWVERPLAGRVVERLTGLPTHLDLGFEGRWLFNAECVRQRTIASGVDPADSDLLSPGIEQSFLDAEPGPPSAEWHWQLLYVGRVVGQKGIHTAIEALPLLPPSARLKIVGDGDGSYLRRLQESARELRVEHRVTFEPSRARDQLFDCYRECDAVVFPVAWEEPWGLVPLEAMALGRPVVATGRGGSGDYLVDGVNAKLFEARDAASLASALNSLAGSPALRERLREGGLETAHQHGESEFNRRALEEIKAVASKRTGSKRAAVD